ncbi:MAG: helix-turn-helix domain-containing protein [Lachnospirales bacterium]
MNINTLISHMSKSTFRIVTVNKYSIPPRKTGRQKTSPYAGFIFPLNGSAKFVLDGSPYLISKGTILHGCANKELFKSVVGDTPWEYILILYEVFNEPNNMQLENEHFELEIGNSPIIDDLLDKIWKEFKKPEDLAVFETNTIFRRILEEVFLRCKNKNDNELEDIHTKITSYIEQNYMNDISVSFLADLMGINESKLLYIFKKYSELSVIEYIISYRINVACELLSTTDMQINEISENIGYDDPFYFSRIFKKRLGMSPIHYRKSQ